jgi:hypothetical protein
MNASGVATPSKNKFHDAWFFGANVIEIDVEKAKLVAIEKLNEWRHILEDLPLSVEGVGTFLVDGDSKANIDRATQAALIAKFSNQPFSIKWSLQDGSEITMDADQMHKVSLALITHITAANTLVRDYKDQIKAANSVAEIKVILSGLVTAGTPPSSQQSRIN